jgi:NTP pyrophosphatase (non-canonical NTP hydrolase)
MTFDEYQKAAWETALPTTQNINYMTMGLGNESGEVLGKVKKTFRGDSVKTEDIAKELGDVLWYCAGIATVIGYDLGIIAALNIEKLQDRKQRGVIQGNGDER